MNWDAIGVIADIVSAVAVVLTLVYLAIQIRHTASQTNTENLQSTVQLWIQAQTRAMRSVEDAEFLRKALHHYDELSPPEIAKFHTFMLDLVVPFDAIRAKHESGLIEPRLWEPLRKDMAAWFTCPGMSTLWADVKFAYPPYLVTEIDSAVEDYPDAPFSETLPYFKFSEKSAIS